MSKPEMNTFLSLGHFLIRKRNNPKFKSTVAITCAKHMKLWVGWLDQYCEK